MNEQPGNRRRRPLSDHEIDLWLHVTRDVAPLAGRILPKRVEPAPDPPPPPPLPPAPLKKPTPLPKTAPLTTLDRRTRQKIARGTIDIDSAIDLHGMIQAEAHRALLGFLYSAHAGGAKLVLVVTGKGRTRIFDTSGMGRESGVLRRAVPLWLQAADLRWLVLGVEEASIAHGGAGALYVRLRRAQRP